MRSTAEKLFGTDQPVDKGSAFALGRWAFTLVNGDLKALRFDGVEVIRSAAFVIRDANWGTCEAEIVSSEAIASQDLILIKISKACRVGDGNNLTIDSTFTLTAEGRLTLSARFIAETDFQTARTGFTVLYPLDGVVGSPVEVTNASGELSQGYFPTLIEPWQPFKAIASLSYRHRGGISVRTDYQGDIFEMEDQRAWSDGSYKVYSRPLEKPWPYKIAGGESVEQQLTFTASGEELRPQPAPAAKPAGTIPLTGCLVTSEILKDWQSAEKLRALAPGYLLYRCHPSQHDLKDLPELAGLLRQLAVLDVRLPLHIEYVLPVDPEQDFRQPMRAFWQRLRECGIHPLSVALSPEPDLGSTPPGSQWPWCPPLEEIYLAARDIFTGVALGGGMLSYFTELNRKRPPVELVDFITHATCPIVHDAADLAVVQTLESLPYITQTTRSFIGKAKPYRLGPGMISMQSNPYGEHVYPNPDNVRLTMTSADPRQRGVFFASWLVGYLAQLQDADIGYWCPAALSGSLGLSATGEQAAEEVWPAWHVVNFLASVAGYQYQASWGDAGEVRLRLWQEAREYWLMANLTDSVVAITPPEQPCSTLFSLSAGQGQKRETAPAQLQAWQVLCLATRTTSENELRAR